VTRVHQLQSPKGRDVPQPIWKTCSTATTTDAKRPQTMPAPSFALHVVPASRPEFGKFASCVACRQQARTVWPPSDRKRDLCTDVPCPDPACCKGNIQPLRMDLHQPSLYPFDARPSVTCAASTRHPHPVDGLCAVRPSCSFSHGQQLDRIGRNDVSGSCATSCTRSASPRPHIHSFQSALSSGTVVHGRERTEETSRSQRRSLACKDLPRVSDQHSSMATMEDFHALRTPSAPAPGRDLRSAISASR
jgi:hypothetical protein